MHLYKLQVILGALEETSTFAMCTNIHNLFLIQNKPLKLKMTLSDSGCMKKLDKDIYFNNLFNNVNI